MPKNYIDNRGWKYRVMSGLGENAFKARYQRARRCWMEGAGGGSVAGIQRSSPGRP